MSINKKHIISILLLILIVGISFTPSNAAGGSITVKIGYYGGQQITKKTYTASQLSAMATEKYAYSYIDDSPGPVIASGRGIKLSTLLLDAGVDLNSAQKIRFYTNDISSTFRGEYNASSLLYGTRYYYPNLATSWDTSLHDVTVGWEVGKKSVPTIVAVESYWDAAKYGGTPKENYSAMNGEDCYRLLAGQANNNPRDMLADESDRWINTIEVMFAGKPPEEGGSTNTDDKLGSEKGDGGETEEDKGNDKKKAGMAGLQVADGTGSDLPWRIYEISGDAVAMADPELDNSMLPVVIVIFALCFALGAILEYIFIKREVS